MDEAKIPLWYRYILQIEGNYPTPFHDVSNARNLWACFV